MPIVSLASANAICSALQLGEILGVTDRRVRQLTKDGVLKCARTKLNGMHYRLGESVQRFLKHRDDCLSTQFDKNEGDYEMARARRMRAAAESAELDLAVKKGFYHRADDIEFCVTQMLTAAKQRLLAIPSRVMHPLVGRTNPRETNQIVDDEIRLALTELSEGKFKNSLSYRRAHTAYLKSRGFSPDVIAEMANRDDQEPL
jgi:phage terminase Nu1 subunit (DNA packaging protein)